MDQDAVLRLTKLCDEVRLASQQLALYRDSATLKALELADQHIRLVTTTTTVTMRNRAIIMKDRNKMYY
jgi:hypothetical protein